MSLAACFLFFISLMLPFCGHAHDLCIYLEAASIDYMEDQMILSGGVLVQHPIGTLSSQRAVLSVTARSLDLQTR